MKDKVWKSIKKVAEATYKTASEKGWWDKDVPQHLTPEYISAKCMLIVSEVAEALEELRNSRPHVYYAAVVEGERRAGDFQEVKDALSIAGRQTEPKPEGFGIELADAVIRIFDLCEWMGIDIAEMIRIKMEYNNTRPYRHGGKAL